MSKNSINREFVKGIWNQNPVFKQVLGMCPTLAVTVSAINGIAMALATTFVLVFSSIIISMIRKLIPSQVRIASYIVVIATFVTIVDLVMKAQFPELSKALGPYIPLIVVNCLILGRQEAFSSKNSVLASAVDALGMGGGFLIALFLLGSVRELFGNGTILGAQIMPAVFSTWLVMILPAGAFITLGLMMAFFKQLSISKEKREQQAVLQKHLNAESAVN